MILTFIVLSLFYSTTFMSICTGIWKIPAILLKPNSMGLKMDNPLSKASADWLRVGPENGKAIPQIYICEISKKEDNSRRWLWKWTLVLDSVSFELFIRYNCPSLRFAAEPTAAQELPKDPWVVTLPPGDRKQLQQNSLQSCSFCTKVWTYKKQKAIRSSAGSS